MNDDGVFSQLIMYLSFANVRYAFIVGTLISLCSSLLGVTLVLRRFSFIGDGLSHVAFGALSVAMVLNLSNSMWLVLPVTILCAVALLQSGQSAKIRGDAAIAVISTGALAMGYLLINLLRPSANIAGDVCTTLFGSFAILTLTPAEVVPCIALAALVVAVFVLFYNKLFAVTFDENFARAVGTSVKSYNLLLAVIIAVVIVLGMKLVGSLLISALVIFPALSAMRVRKSFLAVTVCSAAIAVSCAFAGMIAAVMAGTPVGSTIVAANLLAFIVCSIIGRLRG